MTLEDLCEDCGQVDYHVIHMKPHTQLPSGRMGHPFKPKNKVPEFKAEVPELVTISDWQKAIYGNAKDKGFHENDSSNHTLFVTEKLALIHSEVSECLEDVRADTMQEYMSASGKPEGFPSELADVVIRCLDLAGMLGIDLEGAMRRKHEYNKTRPYKHGKKF